METKYNISNLEEIKKFKKDDMTISLFMYLFGVTSADGSTRFKPDDEMILKPGEYYGNMEVIKTSAGNYCMNRAIIPECIFKACGYLHGRWSKKAWNGYNGKVADALKMDLIDKDEGVAVRACIDMLDSATTFSYSLISVACVGTTEKLVFMDKEAQDFRDKTIEENREALDTGDTIITHEVEQKILNKARESIGDDKGMEIFDSGSSKASFDNNYKLIHVMKGSVYDLSKGKFQTITTGYREGIQQKDYTLAADSMIKAAFSKGMGPAIGGYMAKKDNAASQSIILDEKYGSDCGTKKTLDIVITPMLSGMLNMRYINERGKKVLLTKDNIKSYIGKQVKMYDPMFCTGTAICNKCAGDLYYKIGIKNIGLTLAKKSSLLLQASLKNFHDATVHLHKIDVNDLVL